MLKIPEWLEPYRVPILRGFVSSQTGDQFGAFQFGFNDKNRQAFPADKSHTSRRHFNLMVADGGDTGDLFIDANRWEHVSVSIYVHARGMYKPVVYQMPTWSDMCMVKSWFWDDEDAVVQFHPPKSQYVNQHAFVLHLWRPVSATLPLPPSEFVGVRDSERKIALQGNIQDETRRAKVSLTDLFPKLNP